MAEEANKRKLYRKEQKRKIEATITNDFHVKLDLTIQWERWGIELLSHLEMIVGTNGIALSYVIRQNSVPDHRYQLTWYKKAILEAPHTRKNTICMHWRCTTSLHATFQKLLMYARTSNLISRKTMAELISKDSKIGTINRQCKTCISTRPRKRWRQFTTGMKGP